LVLLEAMACGIPIITTPNTAGPDIITDGVKGLLFLFETWKQLRKNCNGVIPTLKNWQKWVKPLDVKRRN
ncbi:MAG: glycosyltransferase, partial [Dolichospermum sp.]